MWCRFLLSDTKLNKHSLSCWGPVQEAYSFLNDVWFSIMTKVHSSDAFHWLSLCVHLFLSSALLTHSNVKVWSAFHLMMLWLEVIEHKLSTYFMLCNCSSTLCFAWNTTLCKPKRWGLEYYCITGTGLYNLYIFIHSFYSCSVSLLRTEMAMGRTDVRHTVFSTVHKAVIKTIEIQRLTNGGKCNVQYVRNN